MALSILRNGVPLDQLYGTKGASTAAATGCMQNGVDVNQYLLAIADGKAPGFNSGLSKNGTDFSAIFGIPTGNTPLPIDGDTFTATPTFAGGISTCYLHFITNNSSWSVTDTSGGTAASGSIPSGATKCQVTFTHESGVTSSVTNPLSSMTNLSATNQDCNLHVSAPQSSPVVSTYTVTVVYENSAGSVISTTNFTFYLPTAGS